MQQINLIKNGNNIHSNSLGRKTTQSKGRIEIHRSGITVVNDINYPSRNDLWEQGLYATSHLRLQNSRCGSVVQHPQADCA